MSNKKILTTEEGEDLRSIVRHPGLKALMKVINALVKDQERSVLIYDLLTGTDKQLSILKARAEGAKKIYSSLDSAITKVKKTDSDTL